MITIVGAGKFGQTISKLLTKEHVLIDVEKDGSYSEDTKQKIREAERLILCVPSKPLPTCIDMITALVSKETPILSCTKGLYEGLRTPTEIIKEKIQNPVAALMGPNLSVELMDGKPALTVIAGDDAQAWADLFKSDTFFPIIEEDCIGIEFGGALKNIVALGAGCIHGYYGDQSHNTLGSLIAFAIKDIETIYKHKKGTPLPQLSFISDLFATCMSETSRNHQHGHKCGEALAQKKAVPDANGTVEGLNTLAIVHTYLSANKLNAPTIDALHAIFSGQKSLTYLFQMWQ